MKDEERKTGNAAPDVDAKAVAEGITPVSDDELDLVAGGVDPREPMIYCPLCQKSYPATRFKDHLTMGIHP